MALAPAAQQGSQNGGIGQPMRAFARLRPGVNLAQAIADLGFTGFIAHEYSPAQGHEPVATLNKAMEICDV